jgi:hypothetical protein
VLNYALDKMDNEFTTYLVLKISMKSYFTDYIESLSPLIHAISREIINYILDQAEILFTDNDFAIIYENSVTGNPLDSMLGGWSQFDPENEEGAVEGLGLGKAQGLMSFKSFSLGSKNSSLPQQVRK